MKAKTKKELKEEIAKKNIIIEYFKERACCDPINQWGHTQKCILTALGNIDRLTGCQSDQYQDLSLVLGEIRTIARFYLKKEVH